MRRRNEGKLMRFLFFSFLSFPFLVFSFLFFSFLFFSFLFSSFLYIGRIYLKAKKTQSFLTYGTWHIPTILEFPSLNRFQRYLFTFAHELLNSSRSTPEGPLNAAPKYPGARPTLTRSMSEEDNPPAMNFTTPVKTPNGKLKQGDVNND